MAFVTAGVRQERPGLYGKVQLSETAYKQESSQLTLTHLELEKNPQNSSGLHRVGLGQLVAL